MGFLGLAGKEVVVFGISNRRSVGFAVGRVLEGEEAIVTYVAHTPERREESARQIPAERIRVCDLEVPGAAASLARDLETEGRRIHGIVHAVAFARYPDKPTPFEETSREDFLQATQISCHSLLEIARAFRPLLEPDGSVVATSISSTTLAAENYGYMAPIKAALDSTVAYLAKSFARSSRVRCNAVAAGPLKTRSSAGIPGFVDSYLFAEMATLRKKGVETREVADLVAFLLSDRSSGINAQRIVIDAGMGVNFFDRDLVRKALRGDADDAV